MDNNKKKNYLIILVFLAIIVFLAYFCFYLVKDVRKLANSLIQTKNDIATVVLQTQEVKNFKNNYQEYKLGLQEIDKLFASQANPVVFIEFLERTASSTSVVSKASLQSVSKDGKSMLFQISASASSVQALNNFINKLEGGRYLLELQNLNLQNSSQGVEQKQDKKAQVSFVLKVFTK